MIKYLLHDSLAEKDYDLDAIALKNNSEISVGRIGFGSNIELGKNPEGNLEMTVSRKHATITCKGRFFIRDHSTNGTRMHNGRYDSLVKCEGLICLRGNCKLWFGNYGPVFYIEREEEK